MRSFSDTEFFVRMFNEISLFFSAYLYRWHMAMIIVGGGHFKGSSGGDGDGGGQDSNDEDLHDDEQVDKLSGILLHDALAKK